MEMNNKMENIEIWKDIENYEGFYQVSDCGNVKSLERDVYRQNGTFHYHAGGKILVQNLDKYGYMRVSLHLNGKIKTIFVHRLVAEAFIPNPENKPQVNHKDEVKTNNVVENLEWCTASYNVNFGTRNERSVQNRRYPKLGNHPRAKAIFCEELNKEFDCITSAGKELGIGRTSINQACTGKRKTAGKLHWRFINEND